MRLRLDPQGFARGLTSDGVIGSMQGILTLASLAQDDEVKVKMRVIICPFYKDYYFSGIGDSTVGSIRPAY